MAAAAGSTMGFSESGDYFAHSSPDGSLKIWSTETGILKQEYTPSSHLSATCSCLTWAPSHCISEDSHRKKKKKRKSSIGAPKSETDLLALGTTSGSILLYSLIKGDLQSQLTEGHTGTVNDICWSSVGNTVYTCSNDSHIIQWDLATGKVTSKWKGDRGHIFSICLCANENQLLSASRSIKLWDLHKKEVLQTFLGHATEVFQLLPVLRGTLSQEINGFEHGNQASYFLSAARDERLIHAWHINPSSHTKTAIASFTLPEKPLQIMLCRLQGQVIVLGAVTSDGQLLMFEHVLNGHIKKPMKPKVVVQIASEVQSSETPKPIPILASHLLDGAEDNIILSHGNFMKPTFEKLKYDSSESHVCLLRKDTSRAVITKETVVTKTKTPEVRKGETTLLAPGHMAPSGPVAESSTDTTAGRRKRKKSVTKELSLDERLNAISMDKQDPATKPPTADTLATLLAQGLQSKDKKILNHVLQSRNEKLIKKTIQQLPVSCIVPLVRELATRMQGHAQSGQTLVKWMKIVLTTHTSYLTTFPELVGTMGSIYQMMDARVSLFGRLSKLQGRLEVMLSQMTSQTEEAENVGDQQPLLVYQDDSSEEDFDFEDGLMAGDQSDEENWQDEDMDEDEPAVEEDESEEDDGGGGDDDNDSDEEMETAESDSD